MNVKHLSFGALAVLALGLSACSSDEPVNGSSTPDDSKALHAKIQLFLPSATRSQTEPTTDEEYQYPTNSEDGFEIGQTYENNVNDVTIVLATKDAAGAYTPVAVSTSSAVPTGSVDVEAPVFSLTFRQDEIAKYYDQEVFIFAICNAGNLLDNETDFRNSSFTDKILSISSAAANQGIWTNGSFLMANAPNTAIPSKELPSEAELLQNYNTPQKAFDLGSVDVARVVSRFDFKQNNENTFTIKDINTDDDVADIKFLAMAPINIAKDFYLLPRVSNDGTDVNWNLCGVEHRNNWVVSPYFSEKIAELAGSSILSKYFYQTPESPAYDSDYFSYTELANFNGKDDNDENWGPNMSSTEKSGYKIWRYVTENTLPSKASQKKGISTGIVFKAEILNPKNEIMANTMAAGKVLYQYNGVFYGDIAALRQTVSTLDPSNLLYKKFVEVFGAGYLGKIENSSDFAVSDDQLQDCTPAANNGTFKIFRPTKVNGEAHYYVYYTYRNRHNDNGKPTEMGAMEFGTVRNNIYKLAISSVSEFGYTADPGDDPDPEDPDDPDEDPKTYLKVACRVVPWMVRVNNIEF